MKRNTSSDSISSSSSSTTVLIGRLSITVPITGDPDTSDSPSTIIGTAQFAEGKGGEEAVEGYQDMGDYWTWH
ncbi:hypothetical protein AAHA92_28099 [Salvia divinorum]|uniref:Uncharacterized protein n=1 Tax=Salvia divinorum TaxID=28513 RepID=A0ABD1FTX7_SALDI